MNHRCPKCMALLSSCVEKKFRSQKLVQEIHCSGGKFVSEVAVAKVVGECQQHGIVSTEQRELRS